MFSRLQAMLDTPAARRLVPVLALAAVAWGTRTLMAAAAEAAAELADAQEAGRVQRALNEQLREQARCQLGHGWCGKQAGHDGWCDAARLPDDAQDVSTLERVRDGLASIGTEVPDA